MTFEPQGFVETEGHIDTVARGKRAQPLAGLVPRGKRLVAKLGGAINENAAPLRYRQRVDDPRLFPAYALRAALASVGIGVAGSWPRRRGEKTSWRDRSARRRAGAGLGKESETLRRDDDEGARAKARGAPPRARTGGARAGLRLREIGEFERGSSRNGSDLRFHGHPRRHALARRRRAIRQSPRFCASRLAGSTAPEVAIPSSQRAHAAGEDRHPARRGGVERFRFGATSGTP